MPITLEDVLIALEEKYYPGFSLESMEDLNRAQLRLAKHLYEKCYEALSQPIDIRASIVCLETIKPLT